MALNITREDADNGVSVNEKGRAEDGTVLSMNRRLFVQLLVFSNCRDTDQLVSALQATQLQGVLYVDVNDPYGVGLLTFAETPDYFVTTARSFLGQAPFAQLTPQPAFTMLGRTYAIGYESDLEQTLIKRPRSRLLNPDWPWAIWYPLRRSGQFEQLSAEEQRVILMEHGGIGRSFGKADFGHDVRLACHGLDKNDNDFIAGLVGRELHPLSAIVQRMRRTRQTSLYLERLGPFFIGKVIWQTDRERESWQ